LGDQEKLVYWNDEYIDLENVVGYRMVELK
jgi:hypothetical protein